MSKTSERNALVRALFKMVGYTGRILEDEVLHRCVGCGRVVSASFNMAMDFARRHQPSTPSPIALSFRNLVAQALEAFPYEVQVFTAVDSSLDRHYGIDGWFEYKGHHVTFDITLNRQKEAGAADIIIRMEHAESDLSQAALDIAEIFENRIRCRKCAEEKRPKPLEAKLAPAPMRMKTSGPKPAPKVDIFWSSKLSEVVPV